MLDVVFFKQQGEIETFVVKSEHEVPMKSIVFVKFDDGQDKFISAIFMKNSINYDKPKIIFQISTESLKRHAEKSHMNPLDELNKMVCRAIREKKIEVYEIWLDSEMTSNFTHEYVKELKYGEPTKYLDQYDKSYDDSDYEEYYDDKFLENNDVYYDTYYYGENYNKLSKKNYTNCSVYFG